MRSFSNDFLRITKPVTKDGVNLIYKDDKPVFKEHHAPIVAKGAFERRNKALPDHLKLRIEVVKGEAVQRPLPVVPTEPTVTLTTDALAKMVAAEVEKAMAKIQPPPPQQLTTEDPVKPKVAPKQTAKHETAQ